MSLEQAIVSALRLSPHGLSHQLLWSRVSRSSTNVLRQDYEDTLTSLTRKKKIFYSYAGLYVLVNTSKHFWGKIRITTKKHGFVSTHNDPQTTYFVYALNTHGALHQDEVIFTLRPSRNYRFEGQNEAIVAAVATRTISQLTGTIYFDRDQDRLRFDPNSMQFANYHFFIDNLKQAEANYVFVVRIKHYDFRRNLVHIMITKRLGHVYDSDIDHKIIIAEYQLEDQFPPQVLAEAAACKKQMDGAGWQHETQRQDLTAYPFVTIDGSHAQDFDDAICVLPTKNGDYRVLVAIADVSYYVKPGSKLDQTAQQRGVSNYFLDFVIPMLPAVLSNDLCSLKPKVKRLVMVCDMQVNTSGQVVTSRLYQGVIKSQARLCYQDVNAFFDNHQALGTNQAVTVMLRDAYQLHLLLNATKKKRGYIDLHVPDLRFQRNAKNQIVGFHYFYQAHAEKLIENLMVLANQTVAHKIYGWKKPFLYRNHRPPEPKKMQELATSLRDLNLTLGSKESVVDASSFRSWVNHVFRYHNDVWNMALLLFLRAMEKAGYEPTNSGHFGLALSSYTHFTSPIRRYPDLVVHRLVKKYLKLDHYQDYANDFLTLQVLCDQANDREERATACERAFKQLKMIDYANQHVGEQFEGVISSVVRFGFFVQLKNLMEGLVHIKTLPPEANFMFNEVDKRIISSDQQTYYHLGQHVKVRLELTSKKQKQINFTLISVFSP